MISTVQVSLNERSYNIHIGLGALNELERYRSVLNAKHALIITNETIAKLYGADFESRLSAMTNRTHLISIPDGEAYKSFASLEFICGELLRLRADRQSILIALGGGVIGDLTGFAAAIYQRGVQFIQVPTTLLAQVDSSVGGKTAINHPLGKNMIGAFHQPLAVLSDIAFFKTLPTREFAAGMAEVLKHGLIIDKLYYDWLGVNAQKIQSLDPDALTQMIVRSCEIKADIVVRDERETSGLRALLNLGHTFGHAIESATRYERFLHGEAVAIGTVIAAKYSQRNLGLSQDDVQSIERAFAAYKLPTTVSDITSDTMINYMMSDKKNEAALLNLILLRQIGRAEFVRGVPPVAVQSFLTALLAH
jgi:3-dehydroquinate synthase